MFTYAPVDCKSSSSYEATNGVYHGLFLRRLCVDVWCPDVVVVVMCMCVCGGGALVGGGGVSRDAF